MKELITVLLGITIIIAFLIWIYSNWITFRKEITTIKSCRIKFASIFTAFLCSGIMNFLEYKSVFQVIPTIILLISSIIHYYLLKLVKRDEKNKKEFQANLKHNVIDLKYEEIE